MTKAGVTGLPAGEAASSFPEIAWSGPNSPTDWRANGGGRAFNGVQNTFTLQDNLQWTRGKHSVTLGAQMQWLQANEKARTYGSLAVWNYSNGQTAGFGPTGTLLTTRGCVCKLSSRSRKQRQRRSGFRCRHGRPLSRFLLVGAG
jgi:hypothetical protein